MNVLLKNCRLVDPLTKRDEKGIDIEITQGKIAQVGKSLSSSHEVRDLKGAVVAPGFFDMHVHLREPGQEYKETIETGARAAVRGGFTAVACMPNTDPPLDDRPRVEYVRRRGVEVGLARVFPI